MLNNYFYNLRITEKYYSVKRCFFLMQLFQISNTTYIIKVIFQIDPSKDLYRSAILLRKQFYERLFAESMRIKNVAYK